MSEFYFFYQKEGGEEAWTCAFASERETVLRDIQPRFVTVLDLHPVPAESFSAEDYARIKYRGPLYFDFDGEDLDTVCVQFKKLLAKLRDEYEFDLNQGRYYATGGRGFHIEIPAACFIPKVPRDGLPHLPALYKQMVWAMYVDTIDLRVYTARRGRMWRAANIDRGNGRFKVPLTVQEALDIDPDTYITLTSTRRLAPELAPPRLNMKLSLLFEQAKLELDKGLKRKKAAKADAELIRRFKGEFPPTVETLLAGQHIRPDKGFNEIAMQLSLAALAVGKTRDQLLEAAEGLLQNHVSDGRYGSYHKRRRALSDMYDFMDGNPTYDFSIGGVKSLLDDGYRAEDLGDIAEEEGEAIGEGSAEQQIRNGVFMNSRGLWKKTQDGTRFIGNFVLKNVAAMVDYKTRVGVGFEADVLTGERHRGRHFMPNALFNSRQQLSGFAMSHNSAFQGNEQDAIALHSILAAASERGKATVYLYGKEGFSVINHPEEPDPVPVFIYLGGDGTFLSSIPEGDAKYFRMKFHHDRGSQDAKFRGDIHLAPDLAALPVDDVADYVERLLRFNEPHIVATLLGWYTSAHYRQVYRRLWNQFPLLQMMGEAGAGKSQSSLLMGRMHWYKAPVKEINACGHWTPMALDVVFSSSASLPLIVDEFKPGEIKKNILDYLRGLLRGAYNDAQTGGRGNFDRNNSSTGVKVDDLTISSPLVVCGETLEDQVAILDRSVVANLSKTNRTGRQTRDFDLLNRDAHILSAIGKRVLEKGFGLDLEAFRARIEAIQEQDLKKSERPKEARPIFNKAVVIHGLEVFRTVIEEACGERFNEEIAALREAVVNDVGQNKVVKSLQGRSELSRFMDMLAYLSTESSLEYGLSEGEHYCFTEENGIECVDIKLESAYHAYMRHCRAVGQTPHFTNWEKVLTAMFRYKPVQNWTPVDSPLYEAGREDTIFRFSIDRLRDEGVRIMRRR